MVGGVVGAVILVATPEHSFRRLAPFLILASCALLAAQPRLAGVVAAAVGPRRPGRWRGRRRGSGSWWPGSTGRTSAPAWASCCWACSGILRPDGLQRLNALKGLLSLVINGAGVAVFVFSGRVAWPYVGVLAVSAATAGRWACRVARRLRSGPARRGWWRWA